jgi:glutathione S-transferase
LNYKRISYRTVWVDYPDIKAVSLEIGAQPTSYNAAGEGHYTLPAIRDPNSGEVVANSMDIAMWLDKKFPERPVLPAGTAALQMAWDAALVTHARGVGWNSRRHVTKLIYPAIRTCTSFCNTVYSR